MRRIAIVIDSFGGYITSGREDQISALSSPQYKCKSNWTSHPLSEACILTSCSPLMVILPAALENVDIQGGRTSGLGFTGAEVDTGMNDQSTLYKRARKVGNAAKKLAHWDFEDNRLPWRSYRTPYRIFLAEFLLVRTRTDVVAKLYEDIYQTYPSLEAIVNASNEDLTAVLNPLGLQKRVPYLKRAADYLLSIHRGEIPCNIEELMKVPGLGVYTANAIAAFACNLPIVPADVNILRFVSRLTGLKMEHVTKGSKEIRALLPYLSKEHSGLRPQNLLDFTRLICRPRNPHCSECPLHSMCAYFEHQLKYKRI